MNSVPAKTNSDLGPADAGRLARQIADTIRQEGPLPFDRFMALALYHPELGYYERDPATVGRAGDFYTSVSVGSFFGELLAFRFAGWLDELPEGPVWLIEAGAHDGRLAADILAWLDQWRPRLKPWLAYGIVEPSARRRAWQQSRLDSWGDRVRWFASLEALAAVAPRGILFANELLDALPMRRFEWCRTEGDWQESTVELDPARAEDPAPPAFRWGRRPVSENAWSADPWLRRRRAMAAELAPVLPDGFVWEHSTAAVEWWQTAAGCLAEGWLMTLDYGNFEDLPFVPERPHGTLRAFGKHRQITDLLVQPGTHDLTADVDFGLVRQAGEETGLRTTDATSQGRFLTEVAAEMSMSLGAVPRMDGARRQQLLTLVHPEHLGKRHQVLVQRRTKGTDHA